MGQDVCLRSGVLRGAFYEVACGFVGGSDADEVVTECWLEGDYNLGE